MNEMNAKKNGKVVPPLEMHLGYRRFMHAADESRTVFSEEEMRRIRRYFTYTNIATEPEPITSEDFSYAELEYAVATDDLAEVKLLWTLKERVSSCLSQMVLAVDSNDREWFDAKSKEYEDAMYMLHLQKDVLKTLFRGRD